LEIAKLLRERVRSMVVARIAIGVIAGLEILILAIIMFGIDLSREPGIGIGKFLGILLAMAIVAFAINLYPGKWAPWVSGLLVLGPIAVAAFIGFLMSMFST